MEPCDLSADDKKNELKKCEDNFAAASTLCEENEKECTEKEVQAGNCVVGAKKCKPCRKLLKKICQPAAFDVGQKCKENLICETNRI